MVYTPDLAYVGDIMLTNKKCREVQSLPGFVSRHISVVSMLINTLKTKVMIAIVSDEQRQAIPVSGAPFEAKSSTTS